MEKCFTSAWLGVCPQQRVANSAGIVTVVTTSVYTPRRASPNALSGITRIGGRVHAPGTPGRLGCLHPLLLLTPSFSSSPAKCFSSLEGLERAADL